MFYDYYRVPRAAYELTWPSPGEPEFAARVQQLLRSAGIASTSGAKRGFDHGTFIGLKLTYPDAEVPTTQLSLQRWHGGRPRAHLRAAPACLDFADRIRQLNDLLAQRTERSALALRRLTGPVTLTSEKPEVGRP